MRRVGCTLMGYASTNRKWSWWSSNDQADVKLKKSLLHPTYLVGTFSALMNADTGGSPATGNLGGGFARCEYGRCVTFDAVRSGLPYETPFLQRP